MQTVRTGLRCVAWVDAHDPDTGATCFVFDELLQLVERPRVQTSSLPSTELAPIPNALEAFKDDGQPMLLGKGNKLLADLVVDPFLVASLPTRKPFECPATRLACLLAMLLMLVAPISHKVAGLGKRIQRRVNTSGRRWRNHQPARKSADCFHTHKYGESSFTTLPLRFRPAQGGQAARRRSNRYPSPGSNARFL